MGVARHAPTIQPKITIYSTLKNTSQKSFHFFIFRLQHFIFFIIFASYLQKIELPFII